MKERMEQRFNKNGNTLEMSVLPKLPRSLNIEITSACNHNCVFCPYHSYLLPEAERRKSYTMDYDTIRNLLLQAKKEGVGYDEVGFHMTGESVLHKDFAKCVKTAKKLGFPYVFTTTNGALVTPERLREIVDAGLDSLRFSVNGYDRQTYKEAHGKDDFALVMDNLRYLSDFKREHNISMNTSISVVLTKQNVEKKNVFEKLLKDYVDELVFVPVLSLERISPEAEKQFGFNRSDEFEYTPCPAVFNSMYISSEGYVVPCCSTTKIDGMILGNIHETESLVDIWRGEPFVDIRTKFLQGEIPSEWCNGCVLINKKQTMILDQ